MIGSRRAARSSSIDRDCQTVQAGDVESKIEDSYDQVKRLMNEREVGLMMQLDEKNTRIELLEA